MRIVRIDPSNWAGCGPSADPGGLRPGFRPGGRPESPENRARAVPPLSSPFVTTLASRPFLIGVAGGSSSGKTTVAERLAQLAGDEHLALIKLDSYYVEFHDMPIEETPRVQLRPSRCL